MEGDSALLGPAFTFSFLGDTESTASNGLRFFEIRFSGSRLDVETGDGSGVVTLGSAIVCAVEDATCLSRSSRRALTSMCTLGRRLR